MFFYTRTFLLADFFGGNMREISIIDTTLREGVQCPGVTFDGAQSLEIAESLVRCGVNCIEIGHPLVDINELNRVKIVVASLRPKYSVLSHARAVKHDIDAVKETGADWVGIFVGINEKSRQTKLNLCSVEDVLDMVSINVKYAKSLGLNVRYTVEDASRTDLSLLLSAYDTACSAGADRICYSDSVGCDSPEAIGQKIAAIRKQFPAIAIEVHCHDDRGLALANSLSAVKNGANWISSSTNGIGERCGITDTISLIANLHYEFNTTLPNAGHLKKLSRLVSAFSRQPVSLRAPVVGVNAFKHTAKLHKIAVKNDDHAYSWIKPEVFGEKTVIEYPVLPTNFEKFITNPQVISATELKYHRHGPGSRYVMLDKRFVPDCRCYCIVREVIELGTDEKPHVDLHRHAVDSVFFFIGNEDGMTGLNVRVLLGEQWFNVSSPASIFIPSGIEHSYEFISGAGKYINFVFAEDYNSSLLDRELS